VHSAFQRPVLVLLEVLSLEGWQRLRIDDMFSRKTEEEKAAEQAQKQAEEAAQRQAAAAAEQQRQAAEFASSPVGQATTARQAGKQLFQLLLPLAELNGTSSSFGSSDNELTNHIDNDLLDAIEKVGWRLERADALFAETGATSSSRMLATGEGTVTRGTIFGLYIFRAV
jgi:pyruvate-formate lyase